MQEQWNHKVFGVKDEGFEALALNIFSFQAENCPVYSAFLQALGVTAASVHSVWQIPFLPVRFFKSHVVQTTEFKPAAIFESSSTTGTVISRHFVKDLAVYEESSQKGFELFYGPIDEWCIIGLLPSYLERKNSSLVHMVDQLIRLSGHPQSGFYLDQYEQLSVLLRELNKRKQKTLLIGVTFALLDLAEKFPQPLQQITFMETGGMKGRREELIRHELHVILSKAFHTSSIHSEYGMTELLSQAYSKEDGIYSCPPWMKVLVRDEEDPLSVMSLGSRGGSQKLRFRTHSSKLPTYSGALNIIDLANIYSCSFIATDDVGRLYADGSFEVMGRMDGSDLRGCSLMVV